MSGPAIFISHSGKDFAANDASIPADRRARLQYARDVRDLIVAELKKSLGAANVLFDKLRLEPGDQWQAKLHQWLGLCHGAVILLNQEAVASAWVRKETTILTWRRALRPEIRIVPVLLGDFSPADVEAAGFGHLDLMMSQAARLADPAMTAPNAEKLAEQAVKRFADLRASENSEPLTTWIDDVAAALSPLDTAALAGYLDRARKKLGVSDEDWAYFSDRPRTLAHQLLHAPYASAYEAVVSLRRGLSDVNFCALRNLVVPVWVEPEAAEPLARGAPAQPAAGAAGRLARMFAVNAGYHTTGTDYVNRAFCSPPWQQRRTMPLHDKAGEGQASEVLGRFKRDLVAQLQLQGKEHQLAARLASNPFFVVWALPEADQAPPPEILEQLRRDYPDITYFLLAAADFARLPAYAGATRLAPPLPAGLEDSVDVHKGNIADVE